MVTEKIRNTLERLAAIGHETSDSAEARLRKSILTLVGAGTIFAGLIWSAMYFALGVPYAAIFPLGYSVLSGVIFVFYVMTKRYQFFRFSQIFLMLILPVLLQFALGGFAASGVVIIWSVLSPMGALMFSNRRQAMPWFIAFFLLLMVAAGFDAQLSAQPAPLPVPVQKAMYLMNIGSALALLFWVMSYFERERDAALAHSRALLVDLEQRSSDLKQKADELEQQNTALSASLRRLEDLTSSRTAIFKKLGGLYEGALPRLRGNLEKLGRDLTDGGVAVQQELPVQQALHELSDVMNHLRPLTARYTSEQAMRSKRLLLAESDVKRQIVARMALGGTGVDIDTASSLEEGKKKVAEQSYDIVCVDSTMMELAAVAQANNKDVKAVFMTSEDIKAHLSDLRKNPLLSNVVCRDDGDRTFTVKNITTTVSKLVNQDLFGLEKYLGWGVEIHEMPVISSGDRSRLIDKMDAHFKELGLKGIITRRCTSVAEELLSNAIFDAPVGPDRKPLYNHLPRTLPVELTAKQQGVFRFACDGMLVGISVEDPFGALTRETILDYLLSCYEGRAGSLNEQKGGAGRGLFQIMESSSLVVFNVREGFRTEVCALFNLEMQISKRMNERSFHFFYE